MSRKKAREIALHLIFEMGFGVFEAENVMTDGLGEDVLHALGEEIELYAGPLNASQTQYIVSAVKGVASHLEELDAQIAANTKGWNVARLSRMTMAILRLAIYEMYYVDDVPVGAAINEAVELAKVYDTEDAGAFINGVLGTIARAMPDNA
ncbi:MAG: transcription antitermination factor NusB [Butyricicoccus sp.]|nr:transcription antitermination factor NusB [Butyricicoccus pullicaecorum]MCI6719809.1 transcription antitermination factor NusB [Clostridiales bacterium]MDY5972649.1 transcription antitermination factor NusB [Butyricicoccus sp.]